MSPNACNQRGQSEYEEKSKYESNYKLQRLPVYGSGLGGPTVKCREFGFQPGLFLANFGECMAGGGGMWP